MKKLIHFLLNLFKSKKRKTIETLEKALTEKITSREADRIILKDKIRVMLRKYLKLDANSKYIPLSFKDRQEIRMQVESKFGEEMKALDLKLTDNFKIRPITLKK